MDDDDDILLFGLSWVLVFDLPLSPDTKLYTLSNEKIDDRIAHVLRKYSDVFPDTLCEFEIKKPDITLGNNAIPGICKINTLHITASC